MTRLLFPFAITVILQSFWRKLAVLNVRPDFGLLSSQCPLQFVKKIIPAQKTAGIQFKKRSLLVDNWGDSAVIFLSGLKIASF